ncbi:MAG: hypothetical protein ACJ75Z_00915 [Solirubrobacterales bacterium]
MSEATTSRTPGRLRRPIAGALLLAGFLLLGPGAADAGVSVKGGKYSGATAQTSVAGNFRQIKFTVKNGKITLTAEPTVARGFCYSAPVFTIDSNPRKKLSKRGSFTFSRTFFGNKFDKISGEFVSSTEIEGFATYHFQSQDLCSEGKTKVRFSAKRRGK